jgi:pilus assembly protein Flp/PilA
MAASRKAPWRALRTDEAGGTAIEYGLIAGLIAAVMIVAVTSVGHDLTNTLGVVAFRIAISGGAAS